MTRDDFLNAIAEALNVERVFASSNYWHAIAECSPTREVILMDDFVAKNIEGGAMTPDELREYIKIISSDLWVRHNDGSSTLVLS